MKSNALLKWGIPVVLGALALMLLTPFGGERPVTDQTAETPSTRLSPEEAKALGIEGDTPQDTVATLVGQVKAMRNELQTQLKVNEQLRTDNKHLRERERGVDSRVQSALSSVTQQASEERRLAEAARKKAEDETQKTRSLLSQLQGQLSGLSAKDSQDLPAGYGLLPGDGEGFDEGTADELIWVEPSDRLGDKAKDSVIGLPDNFQGLDSNAIEQDGKRLQELAQAAGQASAGRTANAKPVYTIAQNSTLMGSVAMTALIGRVPIDGTVNDPYPFKVLIGPDNLAANGIELPDVVGAVASGTATGDWTLACVRGQIDALTFVFADGTIRTLPTPQAVAGRRQTARRGSDQGRIRGGLGYLSDPYGIPCISGERRSNAQQYIGSQSLITAAGAGVAALLGNDQNTTRVVGSSGTAIGVTEGGNAALNSILAGGVRDIREWVNTLYGEAFAAVYVQPSAQVALHIDQELTIDYEPNGRKVSHETATAHTPDLD